jgi:glucose/arabinose dehydrogenase
LVSGLNGKYNSLAVDSSGNLYVSDADFLYEYSSTGAQISSVEYSYLIFAMAFDSADDLFTVNVNTDDSFLIMERMPGQAPTVFASGLDEDPGLAFNAAGDLFVSDVNTGDIYEYTPGGVQSVYATGLNLPYALAFDSTGDLFVSGYGDGNITEIAPGGAQSLYATGLYDPTGLAFEPAPEPSSPQLFVVGAIALALAQLRRGRMRRTG